MDRQGDKKPDRKHDNAERHAAATGVATLLLSPVVHDAE